MTSHKLVYFNARAKGETTRMLFTLGGVAFEDHRVEIPDWPALKPKTPWGAVPYLEVDGKAVGQSLAIARYAANLAGMAGKTPFEAAVVDSLVDTITEIMDKCNPILYLIKDETEKAAAKEAFIEKQLATQGVGLEKFLAKNNGGKGFFVGDSMTFADIHFFVTFENVKALCPDVFTKAPTLGGLFDRIEKDARVADYLKTRPVTLA